MYNQIFGFKYYEHFITANGDVIVTVLPVNQSLPWITPAEFRPELVPEELMAEGLSVRTFFPNLGFHDLFFFIWCKIFIIFCIHFSADCGGLCPNCGNIGS